jgi:hypothetical protein
MRLLLGRVVNPSDLPPHCGAEAFFCVSNAAPMSTLRFDAFPHPVADCALQDDGAIGDCRTVALLSRSGRGEPAVRW